MTKMKSSSVSLCKSCYCMTKTIDGRCGKCKAGKIKGFTKNQKVVYKEPDEKGGKMIKKLDYTFKEADKYLAFCKKIKSLGLGD